MGPWPSSHTIPTASLPGLRLTQRLVAMTIAMEKATLHLQGSNRERKSYGCIIKLVNILTD
jgi:hypothetical protein